jgi:hypothetical protein
MAEFHNIVTAAVVSGVIAGGAFVAARHYERPQNITKVVRPESPNVWRELEQSEVDALTAALGKLPKRDVTILCLRGCGDLALSFDNAFESAHWNSGVETPLSDDTIGISVGPRDDPDAAKLGLAIATATRDAIVPKLVEAHIIENRIVLVLGRKPRS